LGPCRPSPSPSWSGEGGIRTHGTVSRSGAFKAPALVHYATSPEHAGALANQILTDPAGGYGRLKSMRAIVVEEPGGPEVLKLGDVEQPHPGPEEIGIKVVGAGVNRADLLQRQGHYPPPPGSSEIIGLEVSGQVAELGEGVTGWAVGDPCVALLTGGGYAAYVVAPAGQVVPPPPGLDLLAAGGVIEVAATVYSNLALARLSARETFLVHGGAGGIGSFAIQYAKALGATVITTAGGDEKLDYCRALGADHAISYRGDWPSAVREAAGKHGVDVILDNMGAKYLADHLRLMAPDARLVVIGMQGGTKAQLDLSALMRARAWVTATSLRFRPVAEKADICRGVTETVWPWLADGKIKPTQHVVYPLAEATQAHARLESGESSGKIILELSDEPG
jgi:putative PIG3 family NAD(P)H quinone oxidoreductase